MEGRDRGELHPLPFSSQLLGDMVSTPEMRAVWTEEAMLARWMDVERAITRVQARLGMIPAEAAREIVDALGPDRLGPAQVAEHKRQVGHTMVAFLRAFREACGPAAEHFHVGPTTQDIVDSGLVLQIRDAEALLLERLFRLVERLCERALEHRSTVMIGRSHQQPAVPSTFGFTLATWASETQDHVQRALDARGRWLVGSVAGATGARNSFVELSDVAAARRVEREVCEELGLRSPVASQHPRTDRFAEVVNNLALLAGSLARMCLDLRALQRPEVGEAEQPWLPGEHWSSTMPNKHNPELAEHVDGLAKVVRGLASSMQAVQVADVRDATRMPVEFVSIPLAYMLTARAVANAHGSIDRLLVHDARMRENLGQAAAGSHAVAERLMLAAYRKTGLRDRAHELLHRCARVARARSVELGAVVAEDPDLGPLFTPEELTELSDLTTYTGAAAADTDAIVDVVRRRQAAIAAAG